MGEILTLYSSVNYTGRSSMEVGIRVVSENFTTGSIRHTNTSYFTMVALDRETKSPEPVAGLLLEDSEDVRRFLEGRLRIRLRKLHDNDLDKARKEISDADAVDALQKENCKVAFGNSADTPITTLK